MKAMVLAAGRGNRLRPLTDEIPKPLLPVAGKPLVAYQLEGLARAGYTDIVMNVAYKAEMIMQLLGDGRRYGVNLRYSIEEEGGLETGGGVVKALPLLGERFLIVSADIYTDYPFQNLREQPKQLLHLVMVDPLPEGGDFGLIDDNLHG
ncbi:MAG: sugar phosphate nucleotidyltransferase, partial [Pseudomonadota bacterium]|nr:sugar phosphate nucleotidyltransferase [Pseudomonadota bacterium]